MVKQQSIDGTGAHPSVTLERGRRIRAFINNTMPTVKRVVDFGAGQGYLQAALEEDGYYAVSLEGCDNLPFHADHEHRYGVDLAFPLPEFPRGEFDLVTSFEVVEHVLEKDQQQFWANAQHCADLALFGIHVQCPATIDHPGHCFVKTVEWWEEFFNDNNIAYKILGTPDDRWSVWPEAECTLFVRLHFDAVTLPVDNSGLLVARRAGEFRWGTP